MWGRGVLLRLGSGIECWVVHSDLFVWLCVALNWAYSGTQIPVYNVQMFESLPYSPVSDRCFFVCDLKALLRVLASDCISKCYAAAQQILSFQGVEIVP